LPGTGEAPRCPVYIDGQHFTTLEGTYDELSRAFQALVDDYISTKYHKRETPLPAAAGMPSPPASTKPPALRVLA
jgi:(E)-4-hydroxy-3-methylbut-2-enyl-diphosphate synthase